MPRPIQSFVLLLLSGIIIACSSASGNDGTVVEQSIPVRIATIEERWISRPIVAAGVVSAREEITLSFKIGGIVARVLVDEGAAVRRGQVLAVLDLREIDAQVAKARSAAAKAERDLERATRLHADSVTTLEQLQNARTGAEIAGSDLQTALVNRQYAAIVAPADGRILRRAAEAGELVSAGTAVLVMGSETAGTVLRAGIADRDAVRLQVGDSAAVRFDAYPGERFSGRVTRLPAQAVAGTRAHEIEVSFETTGRRLVNGMIGEVELMPAEGRRMPVVPVESLVEADGSSAFVFALDSTGTRARRIAVRIAALHEGVVAIADGMDDVEQVIAAGAAYVRDGAAVRIVP